MKNGNYTFKCGDLVRYTFESPMFSGEAVIEGVSSIHCLKHKGVRSTDESGDLYIVRDISGNFPNLVYPFQSFMVDESKLTIVQSPMPSTK